MVDSRVSLGYLAILPESPEHCWERFARESCREQEDIKETMVPMFQRIEPQKGPELILIPDPEVQTSWKKNKNPENGVEVWHHRSWLVTTCNLESKSMV